MNATSNATLQAEPMKSASAHSPELKLKLFADMLLVRQAEEKIRELYPEGDMRCPTHFSIGQEACSAGVSAHLQQSDYAISAHRSHAHYINKHGRLRPMFCELYGKENGCATGRGGSMHLIDLDVNFLGCVPIVGSTIPIGIGAAFGAKLQGNDALTVVYFGDGATESGVFHESLNFASLHKLRVLFVCENNLYSVNTPLEERQPTGRKITELAESHGIPATYHDGQEVEVVYDAAKDMVDTIRNDGGPGFLEFETYRWLEHCGPNPDTHLGYRPDGEFEHWTARCPIALYQKQLLSEGILTDDHYKQMLSEIDSKVEDAVQFAKASDFPKRENMFNLLYAEGK